MGGIRLESCRFLPVRPCGQMEYMYGGAVFLCRFFREDVIVPVVNGVNGLAEGWMAEGFCRGRAYLAFDPAKNAAILLDASDFPYAGLFHAAFPGDASLTAEGAVIVSGETLATESYAQARRSVLKADIISRLTCKFGDVADFIDLETETELDRLSLELLEKIQDAVTGSSGLEYFGGSMTENAASAIHDLVRRLSAGENLS